MKSDDHIAHIRRLVAQLNDAVVAASSDGVEVHFHDARTLNAPYYPRISIERIQKAEDSVPASLKGILKPTE